MSAISRLAALWTNLMHRGQRDRDLDEEIRSTLDLLITEKVQAGLSLEEARRIAAIEFGGMEQVKEQVREVRAGVTLDSVVQDARYAVRSLRRNPGFSAAAVLTLALGIGATTAIFSVVYSVLLKPLPFHQPERLVNLSHASAGGGRNQGPATYFTYRDNQRVFEDIGAWDGGQATITGGGDPEQVSVLRVNDAVLPLLRVEPLLGRFFSREDDAPGRPLRVILTYGYWQRRFGGEANIIGEPLVVDGQPAEIIGVLPSSFKFPRVNSAVMLLPIQLDRADATGISFGFQVLARLKPGVTMSQAHADLARMISLLPPSYEGLELQPYIRSQAAYVIGDVGQILWVLFAAVGVVLLMACGNVANLFLVRAEGRQQDLAVRAALGASRGRLARVLLSESVLLAFVGGALGLVLAYATVGLLRQLAPAQLPRLDEIGVYPAVLLFALCISVLNGAMFGLIAVLKFARRGAIVLTEGGRSSSDAPARHRARNTLVVAQIALALMLMIGSGLLVRTVVAMRQVQPGFTRPETVQTFRLSIPETMISDTQQTARTFESIARRLDQVPGVTSVGLSSSITMDGENNGNWIELEESRRAEDGVGPLRFKSFAPGYFETMGIPIVAGRSIDWTEVYQDRPVLLVSENLARKYWQEPARALGKRVRSGPDRPWREIVGVVGNERDDGLDRPETPVVYWPLLNGYGSTRRTMAYAVRSNRVGTAAFQRELEQAVWSANPNLPLAAVQTLEEIQERSMARTSFAMMMLTLSAGIGLVLAIVGLFGVITYIVTQRTREIGIRIALGAQIEDVRRMFLRHGLRLTATGIMIGMGLALALTRVMSALLFGVGPLDLLTYAAVSGVLAGVALGATYLPARRAARIDPIVALRCE